MPQDDNQMVKTALWVKNIFRVRQTWASIPAVMFWLCDCKFIMLSLTFLICEIQWLDNNV